MKPYDTYLGEYYGDDEEYVQAWKDSAASSCSHAWKEKQSLVHTFFECEYCNSTKSLEEMVKTDLIVKRISDLPMPNVKP